MKKILLVFLLLLPLLAYSQLNNSVKTNFQVFHKWIPQVDSRCDGVIMYGFDGLEDDYRFSWSNRGYKLQNMIGISWGGYKDYFDGSWDGKKHLEEIAQRDIKGEILWHNKGTAPYFIPTYSLLSYLQSKLRKLVDIGISEFFFEEPEIWIASGYGEAFKNEWQDYYNEPWKPQHESVDNMFKTNKLKHYLYHRAIEHITSNLKAYAHERKMEIKCYVATHSIINYCLWNIVSPEASTASLESVDGYIAQVWTGTSRYPNYYNGVYKTRMFEMALMEYSSLESIPKRLGKEMYFLSDPIEDAAQYWNLYKYGYEATYTAEILYPDVDKYEVMPWPIRIFNGKFKISPDSKEAQVIPESYATQVQIMVNALINMPKTENRISGPQGIGVLLSNSMMFQRYVKDSVYDSSDNIISNYSGLVMPLIKRGIHVNTIHMDNLKYGIKDIKMLLMTYSNQKPMDEESHKYIASWVKEGGILIYMGKDDDRFQNIDMWWKNKYDVPSNHLFQLMGIGFNPKSGIYHFGKGSVVIERTNPEQNVTNKRKGDNRYISLLKSIYTKNIGDFKFTNNFTLSRGVYDITSVLTESVSNEPVIKEGMFIDLFTDSLPVLTKKIIEPGKQSLLLNIDRVDKSRPSVLATAARAYDETYDYSHYHFVTKGPQNVKAVTRVYIPFKPSSVLIDNKETFNTKYWDSESNTYLLKYDCNPAGTSISIIK